MQLVELYITVVWIVCHLYRRATRTRVRLTNSSYGLFVELHLRTTRMPSFDIKWGRDVAIVEMSWGKKIVWREYLYWPPRACVTCKIGLARLMSISSTCVSTARTGGWMLRSILFSNEKRWHFRSRIHENKCMHHGIFLLQYQGNIVCK